MKGSTEEYGVAARRSARLGRGANEVAGCGEDPGAATRWYKRYKKPQPKRMLLMPGRDPYPRDRACSKARRCCVWKTCWIVQGREGGGEKGEFKNERNVKWQNRGEEWGKY